MIAGKVCVSLSHVSLTSGSLSSFAPYVDYNFLQGTTINETAIFNSPDVSSLGAWLHIDIPLNSTGVPWNNGTVVLSDYKKDFTNQIYWFTFTTMANAKDGTHPVCGNRRFGIQPHPNGGWQFYILGVDRLWDWSASFTNNNRIARVLDKHIGFDSADELWQKIQDNVVNYINQNQGQANLFTPRDQNLRVKFDDAVKPYLLGQINLQQLKAALGCP